MKCLSLIQPWATLVLLGAKQYETRSWQTRYRGRLAIHASKQFPETARQLCLCEPFRSALLRVGYKQSADLPRGVLLGSVQLLACRPTQDVWPHLPADSPERAFGDYRAGRWAWQFADPLLLAVPVPYPGRLGLFEIPDFPPEREDAS